ncbi:MAG: porin family protein [Pseudomonadales bacterium]|nr:porin family protein [Pseudomonadales bacterium]
MSINFRTCSFASAAAAFLLLLLLLSCNTRAEQPVDYSVIFISASYGYTAYDSDRNIKDDSIRGAALGLHIGRRWSASLFYSRADPSSTVGEDYRYENYYTQGKYYFLVETNLRPYVVFGIGEVMIEKQSVSSDTAVHSGVGVHWALSPKWAVQFDYRYFYEKKNSHTDQSVMSTLVYRFGDGER